MQMKSYVCYLLNQHYRNVFFKQLPEHRRVLMTATHVMLILAMDVCVGKKNASVNSKTQHEQSKLLSGKIYEEMALNST